MFTAFSNRFAGVAGSTQVGPPRLRPDTVSADKIKEGNGGKATFMRPWDDCVQFQGVIIHLDELRSMFARMAAESGDLSREERYPRDNSELDAAIKEAPNSRRVRSKK